jgi:hypothetical protein
MTLPKALLVGDNTDGSNWGGRGQSLALAALLRERFEISGRVLGGVVTGGGPYVHTMLPSLIAHTLFYRRDRARWVDRLVRIQEALGARDYVTGDPQETADTILRYAKKFPLLDQLRRQVGMAELGLRRHKPVCFVNTIFSDCPTTGRNSQSLAAAEAVLSRCADVHVRDPFSVEYAASTMPSVRCRHVPDALFTWFDRVQAPGFAPPAVGDFAIPFPEEEWRWFGRLDFSKPYVCVGGSSLARHEPDRAIPRFRRLVERLADLGLAVYVVESCGGDRFLRTVVEQTGVGFVPGTCPILLATAILTHARLLVSGRFHPTILASLGGTPCVFLEAHSHKMRSLQMSLGYDDEPVFSTFPDDDVVARIVERARQVLGDAEGEGGIRARVRAAARARATEAARTPELLQQALVVR